MRTIISPIFGKGTILEEDAKQQRIKVNFNSNIKNMFVKTAKLTNEDGTIYKLIYKRPKCTTKLGEPMTIEDFALLFETKREYRREGE